MLPQILATEITIESFNTQSYPSRTYHVVNNSIIGTVDGVNALRQTIRHTLSTERYAYVIYDRNHGSELNKLVGKSFDYVEATIEAILSEALTQDDRITGVRVDSLEKTGIDSMNVKFTVFNTLQEIQEELTISV